MPNTRNRSKTNILFPFVALISLPTPSCCSSLDPTTKDGTLVLLTDLGQPGDILAPTGSLSGQSFDDSFAIVYSKTSHSLSRKHDWLPFGDLLVNLSVLLHVSVISSLPLGFKRSQPKKVTRPIPQFGNRPCLLSRYRRPITGPWANAIVERELS